MIRPFRTEDTDALVSIWLAASRKATPFLTDEFLEREEREIRETYLPSAETWVYESDDETVVGYIALLEAEVGAIFVHPSAHGMGYGRALMDHAVSLRGAVHLDVFEDNLIGRRFYQRYGFRFDHAYVHEPTGRRMYRLAFDGG